MRRFYSVFIMLFFGAFALSSIADESTPAQESQEVFVEAVFIEGSDVGSSYYPGSESSMARTARAWASYMIGKDGKTFAPMIEQINNSRVKGAVLKRIEALEYEPATLNGVPVDTWFRQPFRFTLFYEARSRFVSTKLFNKHLKAFNEEFAKESPNPEKLLKSIRKLNGTKHGHHIAYEYVSGARYKYASLFGDRDQKIYALREMILSNDRGLAVVNGEPADKELVRLLIEAGYYGEAVIAYKSALRKHRSQIDQQMRSMFGPTISQIEEIIGSDKAFARPVKVSEDGYTFLPLAKSAFAFEQVAGEFEKLILRCEHKYAELPFKADTDYQVPAKWGSCQMQLTGQEGATAQLIQF